MGVAATNALIHSALQQVVWFPDRFQQSSSRCLFLSLPTVTTAVYFSRVMVDAMKHAQIIRDWQPVLHLMQVNENTSPHVLPGHSWVKKGSRFYFCDGLPSSWPASIEISKSWHYHKSYYIQIKCKTTLFTRFSTLKSIKMSNKTKGQLCHTHTLAA